MLSFLLYFLCELQYNFDETSKNLVVTGSGTYDKNQVNGDQLNSVTFQSIDGLITIPADIGIQCDTLTLTNQIRLNKYSIERVSTLILDKCRITSFDKWYVNEDIDTIKIIDSEFPNSFFSYLYNCKTIDLTYPNIYSDQLQNILIENVILRIQSSITTELHDFGATSISLIYTGSSSDIELDDNIFGKLTKLFSISLESTVESKQYKIKCGQLGKKFPNLLNFSLIDPYNIMEFIQSSILGETTTLETIHASSMKTIQQLDLNAKNFVFDGESIDSTISKLTNMETLRLETEGKTTTFTKDALDNCKNLVNFIVIGNIMFDSDTLPSIKSMECSMGHIASIPKNNIIENLRITNNGDKTIELSSYFNVLNHLNSIDLIGFQQALTDDFFGSFTDKITSLAIDNNYIKNLGVNKFGSLTNLTIQIDDTTDLSNIQNFKFDNLEALSFKSNVNFDLSNLNVKVPKLKTIGIPTGIQFVGSGTVTEDNKPKLPSSLISGNQITHVIISGDSYTSSPIIISETFANHKITDVTFQINDVRDDLFKDLNNVNMVFELPVDVSANALKNCKGLHVEMPLQNPTFIFKDGIFYYIWLNSVSSGIPTSESVRILEGITELDNSIFQSNTVVKSITLPSSLTRIESGAFYGCTSLESMRCESTNVQIEGDIFDQDKQITVVVPEDYQGETFGNAPIHRGDLPIPKPTETPSDDPLSSGAIAGIVIAVIVVVALACVGAWFFLIKNKREDEANAEEQHDAGVAEYP